MQPLQIPQKFRIQKPRGHAYSVCRISTDPPNHSAVGIADNPVTSPSVQVMVPQPALRLTKPPQIGPTRQPNAYAKLKRPYAYNHMSVSAYALNKIDIRSGELVTCA
jgi:hypothetical protein